MQPHPGSEPRTFRQFRCCTVIHRRRPNRSRDDQPPLPFRTKVAVAWNNVGCRCFRAAWHAARSRAAVSQTRGYGLQLPGKVAVDFHADADFPQLRACPGHWVSPLSVSFQGNAEPALVPSKMLVADWRVWVHRAAGALTVQRPPDRVSRTVGQAGGGTLHDLDNPRLINPRLIGIVSGSRRNA
jgi:hypothetical protein